MCKSWGSKGGVVVIALASHQCGPGSYPGVDAICAWVEFVVGSLLCSERFFSGCSGLPLSSKPTFPNSNSTRNQVDEETLSECATSNSLFIYLIVYLFIYLFIIYVSLCVLGCITWSSLAVLSVCFVCMALRSINIYSSSPNGLWVISPWGRRPNGLLTQSPFGLEE